MIKNLGLRFYIRISIRILKDASSSLCMYIRIIKSIVLVVVMFFKIFIIIFIYL